MIGSRSGGLPAFLTESVPDHSSIWRFREQLARRGLAEKLLAEVNRQLDVKGLVLRWGTLIDATIPEAAVRPPGSDAGEVSERDPQAGPSMSPDIGSCGDGASASCGCWTKKNGRSRFGYKAHAAVDEGSGLVRKAVMTPADVHDSVPADGLVQGDEEAVVRRQDPMRAASGGLNRSKMAAPNQGAEDRSVSAEREASAAVPGAAPTVFLAIELSKASWIVAVHSPAAARASLHRLPATPGPCWPSRSGRGRPPSRRRARRLPSPRATRPATTGFGSTACWSRPASPAWSSIPPASKSTTVPGGPRPTARQCHGGFAKGIAAGLRLRYDHGCQYVSHDFQAESCFLGPETSTCGALPEREVSRRPRERTLVALGRC
jgi:hypothetical protein